MVYFCGAHRRKRKILAQYWPEEIIAEILSWLPSKSVLRFSCVCKSWRSLITTDPSFISLHRRHSQSFALFQFRKHPSRFLSLEEEKGIHYSLRRNDRFFSDSGASLCLPRHLFFKTFLPVLALCHGLLCISYFPYGGDEKDDCSSLIICNPSIRRFLSLPKPQPVPNSERIHFLATVAFSFDSRNHDYKIVRVVSLIRHRRLSVEVYSFKSGVWRTLVAPACALSPNFHRGALGFVNGLVHWGAKRYVGSNNTKEFFVLSFDFVDEVFDEIPLPESLARASKPSWVTVIGGGGSNEKEALTVYLVSGYRGGDLRCSCSIWVMKEYGVVESWNKVFQFNLIGSSLEAPSFGVTIAGMDVLPAALCVSSNGEILLSPPIGRQGEEHLYLIDTKRKGFVDLQLEAPGCCGWSNCFFGYYAETLVLLDNASALMSY